MRYIIPNKLYPIVNNLSKNQYDFRFKTDAAIFLLNQIIYGTNNKNSLQKNGWVSLCSSILQKTVGKWYSKYLAIFERENIIEKIPHCTDCKACSKFRLIDNWKDDQIKEYEMIDYTCKKRLKNNRVMESAKKKYRHLWIWFDSPKFTIDFESAKQRLEEMNINDNKKKSNLNAIYNLKNGNKWFLRHEKDKRLHTNLTNLKSELRRYLKYNGEELINIDITNSQLFFLATILNSHREGHHYTTDDSIMLELSSLSLCQQEFQRYLELVLSGTFYEELGKKLIKDKGHNCKYEKRSYNKEYNSIVSNTYDLKTARKLMKSITFEVIFSKTSYPSPEKDWFREEFPSIMEFIEIINKKDNSSLAILLQNKEAEALLDIVTKNIYRLNKNIPLYTIHDSIMTTPEYVDDVAKIFIRSIKELYGFTPKIKIES